VAGRGLRHLRRGLLLDRQDVGPAISGMGGPAAFLDDVHRLEPDLLPAALPGPPGHAAPLYRLPGRVLVLEQHLVDRRLYLLRLLPVLHRHRVLHALRRQARERAELLERACRHAGMDPALAAAGAYLRDAAQARGLGSRPGALIPRIERCPMHGTTRPRSNPGPSAFGSRSGLTARCPGRVSSG